MNHVPLAEESPPPDPLPPSPPGDLRLAGRRRGRPDGRLVLRLPPEDPRRSPPVRGGDMKLERIDALANLPCQGPAESRVDFCGNPSIVRLENWAGRVEVLCRLHALELDDELRLAIWGGADQPDLC